MNFENKINQDAVVPLMSVLRNNDDANKKISGSLISRGYAFVVLPNFLVKEIDDMLNNINEFFNNKTTQYKNQFFKEPMFGYFAVGHKESFRMITGNRMHEQKFPDNFGKIQHFGRYMDKIMYLTAKMMEPYIFPNLMYKSQELDIPLLKTSPLINKIAPRNQPALWGQGKIAPRNQPKELVLGQTSNWGLFDITKYYNDGTRKELNCKEHYDPGLLTLSLRSTEPGLQLKDEYGNWVDAPTNKNIAILWTGKAAVQINPRLKPGMHRVTNCTNKDRIGQPRIAIWYEISTSQQEHKELIRDKTRKASVYENYSGIPMSKSLH